MDRKFARLIISIALLFLFACSVHAQAAPKNQEDGLTQKQIEALKKKGLMTLENKKARLNELGEVELREANEARVDQKFSGIVKGARGGGKVVHRGMRYTLSERSFVRFENGEIKEMKDVIAPDEIELNGKKIKGRFDYLEKDPKSGRPTIIIKDEISLDGKTIENTNRNQPLRVAFNPDGSSRVFAASAYADFYFDGKHIRLHRIVSRAEQESYVDFKGSALVGFKNADLIDAFEYRSMPIKGASLTSENELVHFKKLALGEHHQFQSSSFTSVRLSENTFSFSAKTPVLQLGLDGRVIKELSKGTFEFDVHDPLRIGIASGEAKLKDFERGFIATSASKIAFNYYSGGSMQESLCAQQAGCMQASREGHLMVKNTKGLDVRFDQGGPYFPFSFVEAINAEQSDGKVSIRGTTNAAGGGSVAFSLLIEGDKLSGDSMSRKPLGLHGISIEKANGQKESYTKQGAYSSQEQLATFEQQIYSKIQNEYARYGEFRGIHYDDEFSQAIKSELKRHENNEDIKESIIALCQNGFYAASCSSPRHVVSLSEHLVRLQEDQETYKFIKEYLYKGNLQVNDIELAELTLRALAPSEESKDLLLAGKFSEIYTAIAELKDKGLLESSYQVRNIHNLQVALGKDTLPYFDVASRMLAKYQLGNDASYDSMFKVVSSLIDPNYESDLKYSAKHLHLALTLSERITQDVQSAKYDIGFGMVISALDKKDSKALMALESLSTKDFAGLLFPNGVKAKLDATELLDPIPGQKITLDKQTLSSLINHFSSVRESLSFDERKLLDEYMTRQSKTIFGYINVFHNDAKTRTTVVQSIPLGLYPYLLAAANDNVGTGVEIVHLTREDETNRKPILESASAYPSTVQMLISGYEQKAKDILRDAQRYEDAPWFYDLRYTLLKAGQLTPLLDKTDMHTRQAVLESFHTDLQNVRWWDSQITERVDAYSALFSRSKNQDTIGQLKGSLLELYHSEDYKEMKPLIEMLVLTHREKFSQDELIAIDPLYDGKFPSFNQKIVGLVEAQRHFPIDKIIVDNKFTGNVFSASLGDINEHSHHQKTINSLKAVGFSFQELSQKETYTIKGMDEVERTYEFSYYQASKTIKNLKLVDADGKEIVYPSVEFKFNIYPRKPKYDDEPATLEIVRTHVGGSKSLNTMQRDTTIPTFALLGGCNEAGAIATELQKANPSLYVWATKGIGQGDINSQFMTAFIRAIETGNFRDLATLEGSISGSLTHLERSKNYANYVSPSSYTVTKAAQIVYNNN